MGQRVHDDMIGRPDEALHHAEAGAPARRKQGHMFEVEERGDLLLELERERGVADQGRGSRAVDAELRDRVDRGLLNGRI